MKECKTDYTVCCALYEEKEENIHILFIKELQED